MHKVWQMSILMLGKIYRTQMYGNCPNGHRAASKQWKANNWWHENVLNQWYVPSSIQWNSGVERTNSDSTIIRINGKSCCDVASSHGNRRAVMSHEGIVFAADNSSVVAFSLQPDLTIMTLQQHILFGRSRKTKQIENKQIKTTSDRLPESQLATNDGRLW